ncbi:MAG: hypothetical protein ACJ79H_16130 [Myxococcales bacterium]
MRLRVAALALAASGAALALPPVGRPQVLREERHDVSAPLWLLRPAVPVESEEQEPGRVPLEVQAGVVRDPVLQQSASALLSVPIIDSFEGIGVGFVGVSPGGPFATEDDVPDPQGDVGPNHYVQIVNSSIAVFSKTGSLFPKTGTVLYGPTPTRTLFSGFGGTCETNPSYDGIVLYDPLADRWLVTSVAIGPNRSSGPFFQCIAVSQGPDPMGAYYRYAYSFPWFNDYPKFGVWPDAYYATFNMFQDGNAGAPTVGRAICAVDRKRMLLGQVAAMQCINVGLTSVSGAVPADFDGVLPPPQGEPGFILGFFRQASLIVYRFHVDWESPANSGIDVMQVPVAPFGLPCAGSRRGACVPQSGSSSSKLDALSDRMMYRAAYRNSGPYASIVANHTVSGQGGAATGVRWYEIRDPGGDPLIYQQGTYAPDSNWRWLGSAASDRAGNIGLGFSLSGPQLNPTIAITGRTVADPPGVMGQGESAAVASAGSQSTLSSRWGDYSSLSVDPSDDCTFWYTNQYLPFDGAFNWHTRLMTFQLPGCTSAPDFAVWLTPARQMVAGGGTTTFTVSTGALHGTAAGKTLQLSISALPAGLTATGPTPATLLPGQTATVTIAAGQNAAIGEVPFTLRGTAPDGTAVTADGSLAVIDSDFGLAIDKPSTSVGSGGTTDVWIATSPLFGPTETLLFSVPHVPRGIIATVEPLSARVGEAVRVRLQGDAIEVAGTGIVRVDVAGKLAVHSATIRVRSLVLPFVNLLFPLPHANVRGTIPVSADAAPSAGTTLASMDLMIDDTRLQGFDRSALSSTPPTLMWDTNMVNDGPHLLSVRATDADGNLGTSEAIALWVQNKNECGCSSDAGGWEALALFGLLAAVRRAKREVRAGNRR